MKSVEIRETFLKYFEGHNHKRINSSSLIPAEDPTLLFTNAGMNQFKDVFLGISSTPYKRATSCQKCVRAGGKHNDLENVGFTPRHHTFFEMLGNFSFGDYFKKDAVHFAWELLTKHFSLPKERLRVTVFSDDDEAFELWKKEGVRSDWITRLGETDNFWAMGDSGPCGPCSEIFFDWGESYGCGKESCGPGCPCGTRFLEIWNLVFMQYNRMIDGTVVALPKPSVDTGSGLERLCAVLQGKYSNYDTDLFQPIIQQIAHHAKKKYHENDDLDVSMRVIADHLRAGTFLISDGVIPSNEGRGYVLRRILRRAIRHGKKLGLNEPFLYLLTQSVVGQFTKTYPELSTNSKIIEATLKEEEIRFHETLHRGMGILEDCIHKTIKEKRAVISADLVFKLYDTFGFPFDLIQVIAKEQGLSVDESGFNSLMEKQRSQSSWNQSNDLALKEKLNKAIQSHGWNTTFVGYKRTSLPDVKCFKLFTKDGSDALSLSQGDRGYAIFDETPFYAESGGQVGDRGTVSSKVSTSKVEATLKIGNTIIHQVHVDSGDMLLNDTYNLNVNERLRHLTAINHTATHLLHATLRSMFGDRVKQAGSLVEPERLRFDFTRQSALTQMELEKIEEIINSKVQEHLKVTVQEVTFDEAINSGALAFFDEKYGEKVRVVKIGNENEFFSSELCGGTHLDTISDLGVFKITKESSVASGVRRIEAITSVAAYRYLNLRHGILSNIEQLLNCSQDQVVAKTEQLVLVNRGLQKEIEDLKVKVARIGMAEREGGIELHDRAFFVKERDFKVVIEKVMDSKPKILRTLVDQVRDKLAKRTIVVLASVSDGKVSVCVGITKDLVGELDASKLIQSVAQEVGGTGGGRADFAQAGGTQPDRLDQALINFKELIQHL